jgi:glutathione S-transferase
MITVHHLENSRSQRVLWLLEELGLEYELVRYARDPKTMLAPPSLRAIHPLGKSPVVVVEPAGSTEGGKITLAESAAIIEYFVERHPGAGLSPPTGTAERARYTYWMHYAEGSAMPPLLLKLVFERMKTAPVPFFVKPVVKGIAGRVLSTFVDPQLELHGGWVERALGEHAWFAGETFSAADIQMSFPVEASAARGGLKEGAPKARAWLERIHARPAYQKALERGGPYRILGGD